MAKMRQFWQVRILRWPREAVVTALDLGLRFAVLPKHDTLDAVRGKVVAQTLKALRTVADDVRAVANELVSWKIVWVRLEMRPDCLVCPALQVESTGVVECCEMSVVGCIPKIALQPMRPMTSHRIGVATWNRPSRRRLAFLRVVAAVELAVYQRATSAVVLDRGDAAPLQHPLKSRRDIKSYVFPMMLVKRAFGQRRYLFHEFILPNSVNPVNYVSKPYPRSLFPITSSPISEHRRVVGVEVERESADGGKDNAFVAAAAFAKRLRTFEQEVQAVEFHDPLHYRVLRDAVFLCEVFHDLAHQPLR